METKQTKVQMLRWLIEGTACVDRATKEELMAEVDDLIKAAYEEVWGMLDKLLAIPHFDKLTRTGRTTMVYYYNQQFDLHHVIAAENTRDVVVRALALMKGYTGYTWKKVKPNALDSTTESSQSETPAADTESS